MQVNSDSVIVLESLLRAGEVRVTIITIYFSETLISSFRTAEIMGTELKVGDLGSCNFCPFFNMMFVCHVQYVHPWPRK